LLGVLGLLIDGRQLVLQQFLNQALDYALVLDTGLLLALEILDPALDSQLAVFDPIEKWTF